MQKQILSCLLQLGLLAYLYSDPKSRVLNEVAYGIALAANSLFLAALAYRSFQRHQIAAAVVAALLAFPGLLLLIVALSFLSQRP